MAEKWVYSDFITSKEILSSLPFVLGDGSKATIYCFSIYINSNGTIVSVHSNVTNTVNTRFRLNLRSNKKPSAMSSRHDISSILTGSIVPTHCKFQDRKRAACSRPTGRMEHIFIWGKSFRWYIKHQSKVSFPFTFLVLSPSKGHSPLYWAHIHTRDQKKNKQSSFKYQPPCFCLNGGATAHFGPGLSSMIWSYVLSSHSHGRRLNWRTTA